MNLTHPVDRRSDGALTVTSFVTGKIHRSIGTGSLADLANSASHSDCFVCPQSPVWQACSPSAINFSNDFSPGFIVPPQKYLQFSQGTLICSLSYRQEPPRSFST